MESLPQRRVSSALFAPPVIQHEEPAQPVQVDAVTPAEPVVEPVAKAPRQRRAGLGRAKAGKLKTLQVTLDAAVWTAIRFEALKRTTTTSKLVQRALMAQCPSVAQAGEQAA